MFFVLLGSCSGCQQRTNQEIKAQASLCLIATQTTKELVSPSQQSQLELETVKINGESFKVGTVKKSAYTYDKQGRILTEYNQYAGSQVHPSSGKADSVYYQYSPTAVSIRTVIFGDSSKREYTHVATLDSQGLAEDHLYSTGIYNYDMDGYLVAIKDEYGKEVAKIENGNVVELRFSDSPTTPSYIIKNEYDLSKPGLPSIVSVYGKASRNLIMQSVVDKNNGFLIVPKVYTTTYTYTFDDKGRVKRQFLRHKEGEIGWIYGDDSAGVIDFTYTCP